MSRAILLGLLHAGLICSSVSAEDRKAEDLKQLKGEWLEESREVKGKKMAGGSRLTIDESDLRLLTADGTELSFEFRIVIDATRPPKEFAAEVIDSGLGKTGMGFPGRVLGIYELDGDTLKICWGNGTRPTAFESNGGASHYNCVYKRVQKKDDTSSAKERIGKK